MRKPPEELVDAIVWSLKNDESWTIDYYYARHARSGISIWVANRSWALRIRVGGVEYGGVVVFGWMHRWRRRVWSAVKEIGHPDTMRAIAKLRGVA